MSKQKALAYFCPTTVMLVDDNEGFLKSTIPLLSKDKAIYRTFTDPTKVYEYLMENYQGNDLMQQCVDQETDPNRGHRNVDITLAPIREAIYDPKRFEHVSVLVVDHDMPEMNGLDLCRQLSDFPIKKILLTGVASDQQAIAAFNEGVIDAFITKSSEGMEQILNDKIQELSHKQLEEETSIVIENLTYPRPGYEPSCLGDPAFVSMFGEIVHENKICEYYLSEENGSYMFFDELGKPSWLVIKDKDEMESDFYLADDSKEQPSQEILNGLKDCKMIVHMFDKIDESTPATQWEQKGLLHPAKALKGREETYYYAYIDNPDAHNIGKDKIVSFRAYQEQL